MLIDCRRITTKVLEELKERAEKGPKKRLVFAAFGSTLEQKSFARMKMRMAEEIGVDTSLVEEIPGDTAHAVELIERVGAESADGIVVQLPLPSSVDTDLVLDSVPVEQDIDMLSHSARTLYIEGRTSRVPPVAGAIDEILKDLKTDLEGKRVLILGKGRLVGRSAMLYFDKAGQKYAALDKESSEEEILQELNSADVVVSGMGAPGYIKPHMVKEGALLIDAGTSESRGRVVGDADPSCAENALLTPVPGGVGPLAVACLFRNLYL